jgi:hypothetical protein
MVSLYGREWFVFETLNVRSWHFSDIARQQDNVR